MDATLLKINEMESGGIISRYAISGALAYTFYSGPVLTYDLEILCFVPGKKDLSSVLDHLRDKDLSETEEHVLIAAVPVRFVAATDELSIECLKTAVQQEYKGLETRVLKFEHLLAFALARNQAFDPARVKRIIEQHRPDYAQLADILKRYDLTARWQAAGLPLSGG